MSNPSNPTVVPYQDSQAAKKEQVALMFDNISPSYDRLNLVLSLGIDRIWRKTAINMLKKYKPQYILDIATGTADFALAALALKPKRIIGVDISEGMLSLGRKKISNKKLSHLIELQTGDSEKLLFENNTFDVVTVAFGVRNFENLQAGLSEIYRVLQPGGAMCVLEFSNPRQPVIKKFYDFYSAHILPRIGRTVSKDTAAYSYLPESVKAFADGQNFLDICHQCGFISGKVKVLTFGICSIYLAEKPLS